MDKKKSIELYMRETETINLSQKTLNEEAKQLSEHICEFEEASKRSHNPKFVLDPVYHSKKLRLQKVVKHMKDNLKAEESLMKEFGLTQADLEQVELSV